MRSVMKHQFSQVPRAEIQRSSFDRSHGFKTTLDAGWLVPFYCDEVLPGDTFSMQSAIFMRMSTPLHPFMDNMFVDVFFFYAPTRLLWTNFVKMMGEQDNPGDSTSYINPTSTAPVGGYGEMSLQDYLGLPTKIAGYSHVSLPMRMYNLTWNQWFRDENLQNSVTVDKGDGPDTPSNYVLLKRGKRHDYFTSALPWPQKGADVSMTLGTVAPVYGTGKSLALWDGSAVTGLFAKSDNNLIGTDTAYNVNVGTSPTPSANNTSEALGLATAAAMGAPNSGIYADLSGATAATINALRQAFQIQRLYERDARGGTRYTEIIQAHFNVVSPDARLQRVEYLGGGTTPLNVNPIAQTSNTAGAPTPQGNLAAMGTVHAKGIGFTKSFTEHGYVMGLIMARADLNYQQGLNRMWSRSTRFDYYWPALAHLGEQAIYNREIYLQATSADAEVFGYQERNAEYRYKPSLVTGQFRSNATLTLDTWHLAQKFTSLPTLGSTFIVEDPPVDRVIAVPTEPHFLLDVYNSLRCARPMPVFGVPGLIDHF